MGDEPRISELQSLIDGFGLTDTEQYKLAIAIGDLLARAWAEGHAYAEKYSFSERWRERLRYNEDVALLAQMPAKTEH